MSTPSAGPAPSPPSGASRPPARAALPGGSTGKRRALPLRLAGCAHPAPAALVTVVAAALAFSFGRPPAGCAVLTGAVLAGQLSIGWGNDLLDAARDRAAGRRDKPLARGDVPPRTVAAAIAVALTVCVALSLAAGWAAGAAHLVGVACGWAYNVRLKRTAWSPLPYAVAFGLLPAFVSLGLPGGPWPAPHVTAAAALLGVGAHAANVLPDIDDDLAAGVRGLPQRLGPRRSRFATACALAAASGCLLLGGGGLPGVLTAAALTVTVALSVLAAALPGAPNGRRLPFLATLAVAALDVTLLVLRGGGAGG